MLLNYTSSLQYALPLHAQGRLNVRRTTQM